VVEPCRQGYGSSDASTAAMQKQNTVATIAHDTANAVTL
jgi:hypothetical protein